MLKSEGQKQEKFFHYIDHSIVKNHRVSHAYLLEVANISEYMNYVLEMVKMILGDYCKEDSMRQKMEKQVEEGNYPDLKIITPDGSWIKKEQLIHLESEFSKKSMLDNKLIYVIDKAENLNDSSANTILKFLEEPEPNIVAILLTNNRYQVLDTIVSRCQVLSLTKEDDGVFLEPSFISFIKDICKSESLIISFDSYQNSLFYDREISKKNLELLERTFCDHLDQNDNRFNQVEELKNMKSRKILQCIEIFADFKTRLQYNVNLKLWLTDLLVTLMEVF